MNTTGQIYTLRVEIFEIKMLSEMRKNNVPDLQMKKNINMKRKNMSCILFLESIAAFVQLL